MTASFYKVRSILSLKPIFKSNKLLSTSANYFAAWNRDWKPGPYPTTEKEREEAAKKYGLHPKDYKPYDDDGTGLGDYPKLPIVSEASRDPYDDYDYPEAKRNFGEPLNADYDIYTEDRVDGTKRLRISHSKMFLSFVGVVSAWYIFHLFSLEYTMSYNPIMAPQMPGKGITHYTFENPK